MSDKFLLTTTEIMATAAKARSRRMDPNDAAYYTAIDGNPVGEAISNAAVVKLIEWLSNDCVECEPEGFHHERWDCRKHHKTLLLKAKELRSLKTE